jgi:hypothetical protein
MILIAWIGFTKNAFSDSLEEKIQVLLRVMSYQKKTKTYAEYTVAVVYDLNVSESTASKVAKAFKQVEGVKIAGKKLNCVKMAFGDEASLKIKLLDSRVNAVYLIEGNSSATVDKILTLCKELKLLSVAGEPEFVSKNRATLGLSKVSGKFKIMINRQNSIEEGVYFDTRLLRMAM